MDETEVRKAGDQARTGFGANTPRCFRIASRHIGGAGTIGRSITRAAYATSWAMFSHGGDSGRDAVNVNDNGDHFGNVAHAGF